MDFAKDMFGGFKEAWEVNKKMQPKKQRYGAPSSGIDWGKIAKGVVKDAKKFYNTKGKKIIKGVKKGWKAHKELKRRLYAKQRERAARDPLRKWVSGLAGKKWDPKQGKYVGKGIRSGRGIRRGSGRGIRR